MLNTVIPIALTMLAVAAVITFVRVLLGPTLPDRGPKLYPLTRIQSGMGGCAV